MEVKEMEALRKKVENYCVVIVDYANMLFPATPKTKTIEWFAELRKNEKFQELRKRVVELRKELETLFLQISEQSKVAREYAEELMLIADLVWLWNKPPKIVRALENLPLKT